MGVWVWIATSAGVIAAVALAAWRGERGRRSVLEALRGELEEALASAREEVKSLRDGHGGRDRELQELRRKLDKTRRRAHRTREDHQPINARLRELEEKLASNEREFGHARDEVARLESALARASQDAARLGAELAQEKRKAPPPPPQDSEWKRRNEAAEEEVRRLGAQCRDFEREIGRHRQQSRTYRRLYGMIQGELELAREKVRHLQGLPPSKRPRAPDALAAGGAETRDELEAALASAESASPPDPGETSPLPQT